ncbi:MAG: hypothetical protein ACH350_02240 [Parachlamydiaceae bacterium]
MQISHLPFSPHLDLEAGHTVASRPNPQRILSVNLYWGSVERKVVTLYQISAAVLTLAGVIALIEGILLRDPYIFSGGVIIIAISGGGALLAHRYRLLKNLDEVTTALEQENDTLKNSIQSLEQDIGRFKIENQEFKKNVNALKTQIDQTKQENQKFLIANQTLEQELSKIQHMNQELKNSANQLSLTNKELNDKLSKLHEEIGELTSFNDQLNKQIGELEEASESISVSAKDLVTNRRALDLLKSQYETLKVQFQEAQEKEITHDLERQEFDKTRQALDKKQQEEEVAHDLENEELDKKRIAKEEEMLAREMAVAQKEEAILQQLQDLLKYKQLINAVKTLSPQVFGQACDKMGIAGFD